MILNKAGKTGEIQLKLFSLVCFLKLLFQEAFWTNSFLPLAYLQLHLFLNTMNKTYTKAAKLIKKRWGDTELPVSGKKDGDDGHIYLNKLQQMPGWWCWLQEQRPQFCTCRRNFSLLCSL